MDEKFLPLLSEFNLSKLQRASGTVYGMWPDLTLAYRNTAWNQFSSGNGGEPTISRHWNVGSFVPEAISDALKPFFVENFSRCLSENRPWEHLYECSSADTFRKFHMIAFPLMNGNGLLVVNSLFVVRPQTHPVYDAAESYKNANGMICQCCHCRRVRHGDDSSRWDWVPTWVTASPRFTSHGLCPECFTYHYVSNLACTRKSFFV